MARLARARVASPPTLRLGVWRQPNRQWLAGLSGRRQVDHRQYYRTGATSHAAGRRQSARWAGSSDRNGDEPTRSRDVSTYDKDLRRIRVVGVPPPKESGRAGKPARLAGVRTMALWLWLTPFNLTESGD